MARGARTFHYSLSLTGRGWQSTRNGRVPGARRAVVPRAPVAPSGAPPTLTAPASGGYTNSTFV